MIENNEYVGEQPKDLNIQAVATGDDLGIDKNPEGSPLGKFKDSESLLNAYNELQSEFTRKCQKLSEAEKKLQESSIDQMSGIEELEKNKFAWNTNNDVYR